MLKSPNTPELPRVSSKPHFNFPQQRGFLLRKVGVRTLCALLSIPLLFSTSFAATTCALPATCHQTTLHDAQHGTGPSLLNREKRRKVCIRENTTDLHGLSSFNEPNSAARRQIPHHIFGQCIPSIQKCRLLFRYYYLEYRRPQKKPETSRNLSSKPQRVRSIISSPSSSYRFRPQDKYASIRASNLYLLWQGIGCLPVQVFVTSHYD